MPSERWTPQIQAFWEQRAAMLDTTNQVEDLKSTLSKFSRDELGQFLIELAAQDRKILRSVQKRFLVEMTFDTLVAATRLAIYDATYCKGKKHNTNFDYDREAYETVRDNFQKLIDSDQLEMAMELAVELARKGFDQISASDEGMMTEDLTECIQVVLQAILRLDSFSSQNLDWCEMILHIQCVEYNCEKQIIAVRDRMSDSLK